MIHFNDEVSRFKDDRNIHSKYTSTAKFGNLQVAHSTIKHQCQIHKPPQSQKRHTI